MAFKTRSNRGPAIGFALGLALVASVGAADENDERHVGRSSVYGSLQDSSLEAVSTPDAILAATQSNAAPMEVWRVLEHGERVECLDCIPSVAGLLYDGHAGTREIAAWWLRRRIFGVFGPGQVYSQLVDTLASDASETRRAHAAEAIGEFLVGVGVQHVARAAAADGSALVRESAVRALERLNADGPNGELASAVRDGEANVRRAAIMAASHISAASAETILAIVERVGDEDASVRRAAAEVLGSMRIVDAALEVSVLTDPDRESDPEVRKAAVAALGELGDTTLRDAVEAAENDPDFLVRSAARIALRQL